MMFKEKIIFLTLELFIFFGFGFDLYAFKRVPVVFIHKNDSYYLEHSLWQAKQYNERVILIGDKSNNNYKNIGVEHHNISKYFKGAGYFSKIYVHIHEKKQDAQIINFQRWFILQEFMKANNVDCCMYCDSDVMLYCDVTKDYENFSQFDISLVIPKGHSHCGSNSFWTFKALTHFCDYLKQYYKNKDNLKKWLEWFSSPERKRGHGVGDMALLTEYALFLGRTQEYFLDNICNVVDYATFDHQMSDDDGGAFKMKTMKNNVKEYLIKDIKWIDGIPYCYHKQYKRLLRLKSLHFQGGKKILMESCRMSKI